MLKITIKNPIFPLGLFFSFIHLFNPGERMRQNLMTRSRKKSRHLYCNNRTPCFSSDRHCHLKYVYGLICFISSHIYKENVFGQQIPGLPESPVLAGAGAVFWSGSYSYITVNIFLRDLSMSMTVTMTMKMSGSTPDCILCCTIYN